MATGYEVLNHLIPNGGWVITGNEFEGIEFIDAEPITKKQFVDGFAQVDAIKASIDADKATAKEALLDRLGISAEEAALLLG